MIVPLWVNSIRKVCDEKNENRNREKTTISHRKKRTPELNC